MKNIIVTGGTGFIGSNVAAYLESQGYNVWVISRKRINKNNIITCDISQSIDLLKEKKLKDIDCIIHIAAHIPEPENKRDAELCQKANFDSTFSLLEYSKINTIKKFLYISSFSIFNGSKESIIEEDTTPIPISDYALSKVAVEYLCRSYFNKFGISASILRLGSVYGDKMKENRMIPYFLNKCILNETIDVYNAEMQLNVSYVKDVCRIIEKIMFAPVGTYNFSTESFSKGEMVDKISKAINSKSQINYDRSKKNSLVKYSIEKIESILSKEEKKYYSFDDGIKDLYNIISSRN